MQKMTVQFQSASGQTLAGILDHPAAGGFMTDLQLGPHGLTADERQRLLQIADKCPAHRTLHGEVKVRAALD
jgi:uncharacterized OsmC-like protein